jgi:hypothetical protein
VPVNSAISTAEFVFTLQPASAGFVYVAAVSTAEFQPPSFNRRVSTAECDIEKPGFLKKPGL